MKYIKPTLITLSLLVLLVILTGFIYEQVSRMKAQKYEVGETFADVGGYKLHYKAMGTGNPTVVFESGLDAGGLLPWYKVQPEVAKYARTFSYDRAGILMSERGDKPKTGENMANDLYIMLKKTGHNGPYILVGHSMAGVTLRSFVDKYPNEVAGVVFVDASHPLQGKRFAKFPSTQSPALPADWLTRLSCDFGFTRFRNNNNDNAYPSTKPSDRINAIASAFIPVALPAAFEETRAIESIYNKAEHLRNFGDIPLIVITGTNKNRETEGFSDAKTGYECMKIWLELQNDHLKLSTNSKHIFADNSGHYVQLDEPEVVIDAVKELINQ